MPEQRRGPRLSFLKVSSAWKWLRFQATPVEGNVESSIRGLYGARQIRGQCFPKLPMHPVFWIFHCRLVLWKNITLITQSGRGRYGRHREMSKAANRTKKFLDWWGSRLSAPQVFILEIEKPLFLYSAFSKTLLFASMRMHKHRNSWSSKQVEPFDHHPTGCWRFLPRGLGSSVWEFQHACKL